jgi:hypothetical protein
MLDLIVRHEQFIKSFQVLLYEQEGELFRFKAELIFKDESKIFIKEYVFKGSERKYAYHWPDILTFPHHKHINSAVDASSETSLADVLEVIVKTLAFEKRRQ